MNYIGGATLVSCLFFSLSSCQKQESKASPKKEDVQKSLKGLNGALVKDYVLGVPAKDLKVQIDKFSTYYGVDVKGHKFNCETLFPYTHSNYLASGKFGEQNFFKYKIPEKDNETSKYKMYMQLNPRGQQFKTLEDFNHDLSLRTSLAKDEIKKVAEKYGIKFDFERLQNWASIYASGGSNCSTFLHSESNSGYVGTKRSCKYLDIPLERDEVKVMTLSGSGLLNDEIYFYGEEFLYAYVEVENIDIDHLIKILSERLKKHDLAFNINYNQIKSSRIDPVRESKYVEVYSKKLLSLRNEFSGKCSEISFAHLLSQLSERESLEESNKDSTIEGQVKASGI